MAKAQKTIRYFIRADDSFVAIEASDKTFEQMFKFDRALGVKSLVSKLGMELHYPNTKTSEIPLFRI